MLSKIYSTDITVTLNVLINKPKRKYIAISIKFLNLGFLNNQFWFNFSREWSIAIKYMKQLRRILMYPVFTFIFTKCKNANDESYSTYLPTLMLLRISTKRGSDCLLTSINSMVLCMHVDHVSAYMWININYLQLLVMLVEAYSDPRLESWLYWHTHTYKNTRLNFKQIFTHINYAHLPLNRPDCKAVGSELGWDRLNKESYEADSCLGELWYPRVMWKSWVNHTHLSQWPHPISQVRESYIWRNSILPTFIKMLESL